MAILKIKDLLIYKYCEKVRNSEERAKLFHVYRAEFSINQSYQRFVRFVYHLIDLDDKENVRYHKVIYK